MGSRGVFIVVGRFPWKRPRKPGRSGRSLFGDPPPAPPPARARSPRGCRRAGQGGAAPPLPPAPSPNPAEPSAGAPGYPTGLSAGRTPGARPPPPPGKSARSGAAGAAGRQSGRRGALGAGAWAEVAACAPQVAENDPGLWRGPGGAPGPSGPRPLGQPARCGDAARVVESRPGRRPVLASRLPHPDHESAAVGKINFHLGFAARATAPGASGSRPGCGSAAARAQAKAHGARAPQRCLGGKERSTTLCSSWLGLVGLEVGDWPVRPRSHTCIPSWRPPWRDP